MNNNHNENELIAVLLQFNAAALINQLESFLFVTNKIWGIDIQDAAVFLGDNGFIDDGHGTIEINLAHEEVQEALDDFKAVFMAYKSLSNPGCYDGQWLRTECAALKGQAPIDCLLSEGKSGFKTIAKYLQQERIKQALTTGIYTIH